ncbi:MAG: DUF3105 domain-containing protein [Chloroflexi bacterium]|nr:DUF3105 domain-containing protein [Chloroflexota bacterium]MBV9600561.1 DUF3105 domain-containing protein [Chloroflexota bacterium]
MTQTSPQSTERLSSRQRRIEEQRRKIEAARSQQRRKRLTWLAGIVVVVALAVVVLILMMPRSASASMMRQVTTEPGTHMDEGSPLTYSHRPPSSGMHYGTLPQPQEYRMYDTPLTPGRWVHMLEHGAIVVLYRQDLCDDACVQQLGQFYDSAPRSNLVGIRHLTITPYQDMDHAIAVVAWGYIDEMDQVDLNRIMADFKSKVDASSAPERGAM